MAEGGAQAQLELLRAARPARRGGSAARRADPEPAADLPVARVVVDVPLPHLDRTFDYAVPATMDAEARPGVRVRVRFAGQDVSGYLVERAARSDHGTALTPLRRVVSPEPVLEPAVLRLARAVADRYAGTLGDVLRLAVPPRHARSEQRSPAPPASPPEVTRGQDPAGWSAYRAGPALLARLAAGEAPRAVWTALPGSGWATRLAEAVAATARSGRGSVIVLPDRRDVDAVETALLTVLGPGRHARLEADLGPAARYRAFLALRRGEVAVAVGTRAAAFAPVRNLGLVAIWDDGDDLHAEPRAPYPHVREVLALRADSEGAGLIAGGWARTADTTAWIRSGFAHDVSAPRTSRRAAWPAISVAGSGAGGSADPSAGGRLPAAVWDAIRTGLSTGAVLVQVPRAGYLPGLACASCRRPARCPTCSGPVAGGPDAVPSCRWCARPWPSWSCPSCGGNRLRARAVGVLRTAEELGRGFPGVPVVVPKAGEPAPAVPTRALVIATPGLEPPVAGGFAAAVVLDGAVLLERPDLRASEEALRRWSAAAALVRPAPDGGRVVLAADPRAPAVQALVRLDPAWHAGRDLDERTELGLPPAVALATVRGTAAAVRSFTAALTIPPGAEVLGPHVLEAAASTAGDEPLVGMVLRAPLAAASGLARALHDAAAVRSARKDPGAVRVQVDPRDVG